jgi:hypothetical protein
VALLLSGCATNKIVPARLYDISSAEVIQAQFQFAGTTRGSVSFTVPSGEAFTGEYQTVREGTTEWGTIYGNLWGSSGSASVSGSGYTVSLPTEYRGSAIMTSDRGTVITCEYLTNTSRWEPHGQGACQDNRGKVYKLMF